MATTKDTYIEAIGRRKTSTARVRLTKAKDFTCIVNDKDCSEYFKTESQVSAVKDPFTAEGATDAFMVTAKVKGGGLMSQAEAIRHGISRALVAQSESLRSPLKKSGFLKRDPRAKERKKFGLKKARKSSQWSKR